MKYDACLEPSTSRHVKYCDSFPLLAAILQRFRNGLLNLLAEGSIGIVRVIIWTSSV